MGNAEMKPTDIVEEEKVVMGDTKTVKKDPIFKVVSKTSASCTVPTYEDAKEWLDNAIKEAQNRGMGVTSMSLYHYPKYSRKNRDGELIEKAAYYSVSVAARYDDGSVSSDPYSDDEMYD